MTLFIKETNNNLKEENELLNRIVESHSKKINEQQMKINEYHEKIQQKGKSSNSKLFFRNLFQTSFFKKKSISSSTTQKLQNCFECENNRFIQPTIKV